MVKAQRYRGRLRLVKCYGPTCNKRRLLIKEPWFCSPECKREWMRVNKETRPPIG